MMKVRLIKTNIRDYDDQPATVTRWLVQINGETKLDTRASGDALSYILGLASHGPIELVGLDDTEWK